MKKNIQEWFKKHSITEVESIFPDINGVARGKFMPANKFLNEGTFRLPESVLIYTLYGDLPNNYGHVINVREQDMVLKPDFSTLSIIPWAKEPTAQIIHDCYTLDDTLFSLSTRSVLKNVIALFNKINLQPIVAPEIEFYLTQPIKHFHNPISPANNRFGREEIPGQAYSIDSLNEFDDFFEDLYNYCEQQNIDIETLNHEYGMGQMEINLRHGDALQLADQTFLFKKTAREIAQKHNMYATFMSKPMEEQPGSSMHIHQSLIDQTTGKNVFIDKNQPTKIFYSYIAGLQKYIPSAMLLFAPNVNSYRRIIKNTYNTLNAEWSFDNRNVGLRIPKLAYENLRIENRIPGSDANPYLAIAASLICGYLGVIQGLKPTEPLTDGVAHASHQLPDNMQASIKLLNSSRKLKQYLGKDFIRCYRYVKGSEWDVFSRVISSWERKYLMLQV